MEINYLNDGDENLQRPQEGRARKIYTVRAFRTCERAANVGNAKKHRTIQGFSAGLRTARQSSAQEGAESLRASYAWAPRRVQIIADHLTLFYIIKRTTSEWYTANGHITFMKVKAKRTEPTSSTGAVADAYKIYL